MVFLDFRLAGDCGFNVLQQMREARPEQTSAIIMMSGLEDEGASVKAIRSGAQDFIIKSEINAAGIKRCITHSRARVQYEDDIHSMRETVMGLASGVATA